MVLSDKFKDDPSEITDPDDSRSIDPDYDDSREKNNIENTD